MTESEFFVSESFPANPLPIEIRAAVPSDWEWIVESNLQLAEETENKKLDRALVAKGVKALLNDPAKGRYFLAEHQGEIVGQLMHTREWSDWRNGDIWWLQSVYVASGFRRRGVFSALYQHLFDEANRSPDVVGIRLYVEAENTTAHETYRNLGLVQPGYFVMEDL